MRIVGTYSVHKSQNVAWEGIKPHRGSVGALCPVSRIRGFEERTQAQ